MTAREHDDKIAHFLHAQVACWNAHREAAFFSLYQQMASQTLRVEYVGRAQRDGWLELKEMWTQHNKHVRIEVLATIIHGNEAACHHRNHIIGTEMVIDTIELYAFDEGNLFVRYFQKG